MSRTFVNQALIQEETILVISLVLEHGWPAGPSFIHALNTLIEAVVLHDVVYVDPVRDLNRTDLRRDGVTAALLGSTLVRLLLREGALQVFPEWGPLEHKFQAEGRQYTKGEFLADLKWTPDSFIYADATDEGARLDAYLELLEQSPALLSPTMEAPMEVPGVGTITHDASSLIAARGLGLCDDELRILDGLNHRARAFMDLSRHTGLHLHPFLLALPHNLGAIRETNSAAERLYAKIASQSAISREDEEPAGETRFRTQPIPPLTHLLTTRCRADKSAIGIEMLNLRQENQPLRAHFTEFERSWECAKTKRERWRLESEFDSALKLLVTRESRQSTRLIYTLWDVLKDPSKILGAIGDKIVTQGREEHIIGKVKGLQIFGRTLRTLHPQSLSNNCAMNGVWQWQASERGMRARSSRTS
jgi:hypothetical protein